MRTRVILATLLIALLALPVAVHAQEGEAEPKESDPVTVTEGHVEAVNEGGTAAAQEVMAEDAVVTVPQATSGTEGEEEEADAEAEPEPEAQAQYTGSAEYQAWLDAQAKANAETTLGECSVEGDRVTCNASYTSDALKAKGVDFLEGELAVTVVEGKIQAYAFTASAESLAKLRSASALEAVPVTGGRHDIAGRNAGNRWREARPRHNLHYRCAGRNVAAARWRICCRRHTRVVPAWR